LIALGLISYMIASASFRRVIIPRVKPGFTFKQLIPGLLIAALVVWPTAAIFSDSTQAPDLRQDASLAASVATSLPIFLASGWTKGDLESLESTAGESSNLPAFVSVDPDKLCERITHSEGIAGITISGECWRNLKPDAKTRIIAATLEGVLVFVAHERSENLGERRNITFVPGADFQESATWLITSFSGLLSLIDPNAEDIAASLTVIRLPGISPDMYDIELKPPIEPSAFLQAAIAGNIETGSIGGLTSFEKHRLAMQLLNVPFSLAQVEYALPTAKTDGSEAQGKAGFRLGDDLEDWFHNTKNKIKCAELLRTVVAIWILVIAPLPLILLNRPWNVVLSAGIVAAGFAMFLVHTPNSETRSLRYARQDQALNTAITSTYTFSFPSRAARENGGFASAGDSTYDINGSRTSLLSVVLTTDFETKPDIVPIRLSAIHCQNGSVEIELENNSNRALENVFIGQGGYVAGLGRVLPGRSMTFRVASLPENALIQGTIHAKGKDEAVLWILRNLYLKRLSSLTDAYNGRAEVGNPADPFSAHPSSGFGIHTALIPILDSDAPWLIAQISEGGEALVIEHIGEAVHP